ncbi:FG-GAP repeat domain-containing protein [Streptomyces sp. NPDC001930]|uniref:FG-GAP repeat domain-containing protein n=1 Tax=Streptomyces sp. NPDC001930 TaxID=3364625 RepID=UPI0036A4FCAD
MLAVTAAALAVAPAGAAAPAAAGPMAAPAEVRDGVVPFPVDSGVVGSGPTGFLSAQSGPQITYRWTRYADGVTTVLPGNGYTAATRTDVVAKNLGNGVFSLHDMDRGAGPLEIDVTPLGEGYTLAGYAGTHLVMKKANATGGTDLHLVGKPEGVLVDHTVTGLPADAAITSVNVDSPTDAVVRYTGTVDGVKRSRSAVVDLVAHAVVEEYESPDVPLGTALSATHIAWLEQPADSTAKVTVTRRDTGETVRHDLGVKGSVTIQLVGDWLTYRQLGALTSDPYAYAYPLNALSLSTGETVKLLDTTAISVPGAGGVQVVRGGTVEHGEGLYRISPGVDGARPVVTLVASTGQPTKLELVGHTVPETIDFDRTPAPVILSWNFGRTRAKVRVELTHTASNKRALLPAHISEGAFAATWNGLFGDSVTAYNGDYVWRMTAEPTNGVGPALVRSGTFNVVRKAASHDFNDNGSSDLLVRNGIGELFVRDSHPTQWGPSWDQEKPVRIGTGWNIYDQLLAPGNVAGSSYADIVARDRTGVLWLYQGTGHTLAPRVPVGGGWQIYHQITGGSDLNGDGRPDLLATDKAGVLWLYKGTGSATAPFAPRTRIGGGWGIYNRITATENIGGAPAGDLVARDASGVLWLYLGKGDGTFASRTRISDNWNPFLPLGVGDADRDGRPDLVGIESGGGVYFAEGTGDWKAPFEGLELTSHVPSTYYPDTVF